MCGRQGYVAIVAGLLFLRLVQPLLGNRQLVAQGAGPSREAREAGSFTTRVYAVGPSSVRRACFL